MKLGKALATTAMSGMLAALSSGCGGAPEAASSPTMPSTNVAMPPEKSCCKAKNACKHQSGCKTETNASCAGLNDCKGKGTSCPRG